jgi:hypothetical protein
MDPRTEKFLIQKHVRHRHREVGESITWFEYAPTYTGTGPSVGYSVYDDVYDMGSRGEGGRRYRSAIVLPTIYIEEFEDAALSREDGRLPTQNIRIVMLYDDVLAAGMTDPSEYRPHLNDVFFHGGRYYKVYMYKARGRLGDDIVITVEGYEVFPDQEFVWDNGPPVPVVVDKPWPVLLPVTVV